MDIFDYKQQDSSQIVREAAIVQSYAWQTSGESITFTGAGGWKVLTAEDLSYSGYTNEFNEFFGENLAYLSAECNVLGKYDESGKLVSVGVSFWGTGTRPDDPNNQNNTILDALHDLAAAIIPDSANNYVANAFNQLMGNVKAFAQSHGLTGEDIIVTGHSLGGLAVNSMATLSAGGQWGGFFENSNYVAFASPTQNLAHNTVLNIGYENDPVFRVLEGQTLTVDSFFYHDKAIDGATNNIVSFNEFYAGLYGNVGFQSIVNIDAWAAHSGSGYYDGILRILDSEAYKYMRPDSTVVVSSLAEQSRSSVIVQDLHRSPVEHTGTTFIIGTETADLLSGGNGNDYLSGLDGNDRFYLSGGYDVIYGGEGDNIVQLQSSLDSYSIAKGNHDEIYFKNNDTGMITKASNVGMISAKQDASGSDYQDYILGASGISDGNATVSYAREATNLFDIIYNASGDNQWVFISDEHRATVTSVTGNNNVIVSGMHNDVIANFWGEDNTFIFSGEFGADKLFGLNATSSLIFMENENFASNDSYLNHVTYSGNDSKLTFGDSSVTLMGVNESLLSQLNIQFV